MTKDIRGNEIQTKMRVVCIQSSVLMAKMCTHPFERPKGKKFWKEHIDILLNRKDAEKNGNKRFARVLTVKDISNGYLSFYNDKDCPENESLHHYHPANRFMVFSK